MRQSATDIIRLLTAPPSSTTLILQAGDETRNGLLQLKELLNRTEKVPNLIPPPRNQESPHLANAPLQRVKYSKDNAPPHRVQDNTTKKIRNIFPLNTLSTIKNRTWKRAELPLPQRRYKLRSNIDTNFKNLTADVLLAQIIFQPNICLMTVGQNFPLMHSFQGNMANHAGNQCSVTNGVGLPKATMQVSLPQIS